MRPTAVLAAILLFVAPVAVACQTQSAGTARAELTPYTGLFEFADGSIVSIGWLEDVQGLLMIDYPAGRIRLLDRRQGGEFTTGPAAGVAQPVQARLNVTRDGLDWTENHMTRHARRVSFREEEMRFGNAGGPQLAGTLTLPDGPGPFPAVVLIHGSGAQDRNFLWVAPFFARSGVAVLAYDKRGVGGSDGDWRGASLADLARDALAGVDWLRGRPDIDAGRIGLYGSSNGGWVAPLAATMAPERVAFVIARAASGLPERDNVIYEMESDLRQAGFGDAEVIRARDLHRKLAKLSSVEEVAALEVELEAAAREPWFRQSRLPSALENLRTEVGLRSWRDAISRNRVDPARLWERIGCPVLVQIGTLDRYVPAEESARIIRAAFGRAGNRDAGVRLYDRGDHAIFESTTGYASAIPQVTRFVPGYLSDLESWIGRYVTGLQAPRGKGCAVASPPRD